MRVFLDNAATTPVAPQVVEAMTPYYMDKFGNPSSIHSFGRETKAAIEIARKQIAGYFNTSPGEIFFTSGGTESANMIINGAVSSLGVEHIITSKIEHHCVLHPIKALLEQGKVKVDYVELDEYGNILYDKFESLFSKTTGKTLVCLMHANNEIGNITDIKRVGEICRSKDALFFSDTVQTVAHFRINLQDIHVDFMQGSAHKFHGPKGIGFAYIKGDYKLSPMILGGAQERNMRAGTENITGIIGMAKAMELAYQDLDTETARIADLKQYFFDSLHKAVPGLQVNGNGLDNGLYTVLNVSFPPNDKSGFLIYNLDINEIAASAGSACSSGSDVGSHVLKELPAAPGRSSVRFSFSRYNIREEVDYVVGKLKDMFG